MDQNLINGKTITETLFKFPQNFYLKNSNITQDPSEKRLSGKHPEDIFQGNQRQIGG